MKMFNKCCGAGRLAALTLFCALANMMGRPECDAATLINPTPVTFDAEPMEGGKIVYLPVAAETANDLSKGMLGLRLSITNSGSKDIRLTAIRCTFQVMNGGFGAQFVRDLVIGAGQTGVEYLTPDESIALPNPAPASVQIALFFEGFAEPRTREFDLAPYEAPVPGGQYLFPANAADLGMEVYFSHIDPHTGGDQFFGYDLHVRGWNGQSFSGTKPGGDPKTNEGSMGWDTPIYSMAEGVVLSASTGWEDNPVPGLRVIQRMGEHTGESIADVKVTQLRSDRAASAARLPSGELKLAVWDFENHGREIIPRGTTLGETISDLATDALSDTNLVTAVRTDSGNLRVIVWGISTNGTSIERLCEREAAQAKELSLMKISSRRFATAIRNEDDVLRLIVWEVASDRKSIALLSHDFAGVASSISVVALDSTNLITSLRTADGKLKLINWQIQEDDSLLRKGDVTAGPIIKGWASKVSENQVVAAMRTDSGLLKLIQWEVKDDGSFVFERDATGEAIQDLAPPAVNSGDVFTAVMLPDTSYKNIAYRQPSTDPDKGENQLAFYLRGDKEAGPSNRFSVEKLEEAEYVTGLRTATGNLKIITWRVGSGGGNNLVIKHGNCAVLYAHLRNGTVNPELAYPGAPVAPGQLLGRMGNSGSSSGPHTHIHATRLAPGYTVPELIELAAQDALPYIAYRPIPFHCARTVRLSALQTGGEGNPANAFSTMNGHGMYFEQFVIRPTWKKELYVHWASTCLAPTGLKECVTIGRLSLNGPFPALQQALNTPCWGHQLFIHGGSYNESVTIERAMTVESYNGTALIGQ